MRGKGVAMIENEYMMNFMTEKIASNVFGVDQCDVIYGPFFHRID